MKSIYVITLLPKCPYIYEQDSSWRDNPPNKSDKVQSCTSMRAHRQNASDVWSLQISRDIINDFRLRLFLCHFYKNPSFFFIRFLNLHCGRMSSIISKNTLSPFENGAMLKTKWFCCKEKPLISAFSLDTTTHLYKRLCPSVQTSIRLSPVIFKCWIWQFMKVISNWLTL